MKEAVAPAAGPVAIATLHWAHGAASVTASGARLTDAFFRLPRAKFRPLARAPWFGLAGPKAPPLLSELAGDFAGVPFGAGPYDPAAIAHPWRGSPAVAAPELPHGPSANCRWTIIESDPRFVRLRLEGSDGLTLERTIAADANVPAIDASLTLHATGTRNLPIGLHPTFVLPLAPDRALLSVAFEEGWTDPTPVSMPGVASVAPWHQFSRLDAVPSAGGGLLDLSLLPANGPAEILVQLCGARSPATIRYAALEAGIRLHWDDRLLPSLLVWLCQDHFSLVEGLPPLRCIALEPLAGAFSLPEAIATMPNPLSRRGVTTALAMTAGRPITLTHRLEAFATAS